MIFFISWQVYFDRSNEPRSIIPVCHKNNISLVLGGVFNSGILIDPSPDTYFDYSKLDNNWIKN